MTDLFHSKQAGLMQTRIVLTGGPSAGKTTLLELLSKQYGRQLGIAPEAASMLFRGGFLRPVTPEDRIHTQRSIYGLQKELELQALEHSTSNTMVCDRGSLDGASYWAGSVREFCFAMGTSYERELARYTAVLHLETADENAGYTNNDVRTETHAEASHLDSRIGEIWSAHPAYIYIANDGRGFIDKLNRALTALQSYLPTDVTTDPRVRYATAGDLL